MEPASKKECKWFKKLKTRKYGVIFFKKEGLLSEEHIQNKG